MSLSLKYEDNKEINNFKKNMDEYYKYYEESYSNEDKYKFLYNYCENLVNFINTFGNKGNDNLGKKYFFNIKLLFESYKKLIQLKSIIDEKDKNAIINNSKIF